MDTIDLHLDNDNELLFKVVVEGTNQGTARCRLMLEKNDFSYVFNGDVSTDGEVSVSIPTMKSNLTEGNYQAHLEVLVDDRIFVPLTFNANFKQSVKVTAEAVTRKQKTKMKASASIVSAPKKASVIAEEKKESNKTKKARSIDIAKLSNSQKKKLIEMLEERKAR